MAITGKPMLSRLLKRLLLTSCVLVLGTGLATAQDQARTQDRTLDEETAVAKGLSREAFQDYLKGAQDIARGRKDVAGRWENPVFQYDREGTDGLGGDGAENQFRLSQKIDFSGERAFKVRAAEHHLDAARLHNEFLIRKRKSEIQDHFYTVLYFDRLLNAAQDWVTRLGQMEKIILKRVNAGDASRYDQHRIVQELANVRIMRAKISVGRDEAWQGLGALIGNDELQNYHALQGRILPGQAQALGGLLEQLEQRPDLLGLWQQAQADENEYKAARRSVIPDVTVGLGLRSIRSFAGNDTGFLFSLSVPLPVLNQGQGKSLEKAGRALQRRAEHRLSLDQARGDVIAVWQKLSRLQAAMTEYQHSTAQSAVLLRRVAESSYDAGEIGILELVDAYRSSFETRQKATGLARDARLAHIKLELLTADRR